MRNKYFIFKNVFLCLAEFPLSISCVREIAGICDIKKNIAFHLARHMFATTVTFSNGVRTETVSKMLVHALATTQITHT